MAELTHRTRIKICGITRPEDAEAAARFGADAIGMVFHRQSARAIDLAAAREIVAAVPPFVSTVALVVDAAREEVEHIIDQVRPAFLQFHGDEPPAFCAQFSVPYMRAIRMGAPGQPVDLIKCRREFSGAAALLLEAFVVGAAGGTGQSFDWRLIPEDLRPHIVLAGGLRPDNVAAAIRQVRPWAVDVSSGVEGSTKGVKEHARLREFIEAARDADTTCN
ncbi:MAG: phosphoribosylanthranilate isomerase [Betaproteobacteria bacterium]|nr:phosphoribosylanthranilate isomerase [Betaproteobacteria bacterium]